MQPQPCPQCSAPMDAGLVEMRPDIGSESSTIDCWFVSRDNEDWLVLPRWDKKEAHRCPNCGTTLILRGN